MEPKMIILWHCHKITFLVVLFLIVYPPFSFVNLMGLAFGLMHVQLFLAVQISLFCCLILWYCCVLPFYFNVLTVINNRLPFLFFSLFPRSIVHRFTSVLKNITSVVKKATSVYSNNGDSTEGKLWMMLFILMLKLLLM